MLTNDELADVLTVVDQRRLMDFSGWIGFLVPLNDSIVFVVTEHTPLIQWH